MDRDWEIIQERDRAEVEHDFQGESPPRDPSHGSEPSGYMSGGGSSLRPPPSSELPEPRVGPVGTPPADAVGVCVVCAGPIVEPDGSPRAGVAICVGDARHECHLACAGLDDVPDGDWSCPRCDRRSPPRAGSRTKRTTRVGVEAGPAPESARDQDRVEPQACDDDREAAVIEQDFDCHVSEWDGFYAQGPQHHFEAYVLDLKQRFVVERLDRLLPSDVVCAVKDRVARKIEDRECAQRGDLELAEPLVADAPPLPSIPQEVEDEVSRATRDAIKAMNKLCYILNDGNTVRAADLREGDAQCRMFWRIVVTFVYAGQTIEDRINSRDEEISLVRRAYENHSNTNVMDAFEDAWNIEIRRGPRTMLVDRFKLRAKDKVVDPAVPPRAVDMEV